MQANDYLPMRTLAAEPGRVWTAWRSPGRFTKNPDVVQLPGRAPPGGLRRHG